MRPLISGPPTCWPPLRVAGGGRDDDTSFDQAGQLVDLLGVVAAVGHRHDHDVGHRRVKTGPDRPRRPWTVAVEDQANTVILFGVLLDPGDRRVFSRVADDQDLAREDDGLTDPAERTDYGLALVTGGDHD